jgi:Ni/Fe-hydrogenase subunit HybB-like protein
MTAQEILKDAGNRRLKKLPPIWAGILIILLLSGGYFFLSGIRGAEPFRSWQIFMVNLLFWGGLAQGCFVFSPILHVSEGGWGRPLKRIAEGMWLFTPFALLLYLVLFSGGEVLFPWVKHPYPGKEQWLSLPNVAARDLLGLLVLCGLNLAYLASSLRPDLGALRELGIGKTNALWALLTKNWKGLAEEQRKSDRVQGTLAIFCILAFVLVMSLLAFDLIMPLDPQWYSTLFGVYYFVGCFYSGLALIVILATVLRRSLDLEAYLKPETFYDQGKLLLGFCAFWTAMFWSQYLVIWYGNLPEETRFLTLRMYQPPWPVISWAAVLLLFAVPFVVLLSREIKFKPWGMFPVALLIVLAMGLERFVLIVPSIWHGSTIPFGLSELAISLGFGALFLLSLLVSLRLVPVFPLSDPKFVNRFSKP